MCELNKFIKSYWEKLEFKKWDYIFHQWDSDDNLYFINFWRILLLKNWKWIFTVSDWEIVWEKSFIEWIKKPLSWKVMSENAIVYKLNSSSLASLDKTKQIDFYRSLSLFISNRVYNINEILYNITNINSKIINFKSKANTFNNDIFQHLFSWLIDVDDFFLLKDFEWEYQKVLSNSMFNENLSNILDALKANKNNIIVWEGLLYFKSWDYIYLIFWEKIINDYIVYNTISYCLPLFTFLAESFENNTVDKFLKMFK